MSIQESGELHNARPTLWHAHWRLAGNGPVLLLDRNFIGLSSSLDEKEYTMSAMSNLHLQLTTAMNHTADKLRDATADGSGEVLEATCMTAIEILQICANALAEIREASEGVSSGH